jgi:WD40 repeat protein
LFLKLRSTGSTSGGGFKSAAQRKLDALNAASRKWQQRRGEDEEEEVEGAGGVDDAEAVFMDNKKPKLAHPLPAAAASASAAATSSVARAASSGADDDGDDAQAVSDASAAEQAMLAAMFPSSFGKAAKTGPDLAKINERHVRKDRDAVPIVKLEGAPDKPAGGVQQQRPAPRNVAPAPPPSLLGGSYDSSDDDDADSERKGAPPATATAPVAAASGAAMSTDDEADSDDDDDDGGALDASGRKVHPLVRSLPISHEAELRLNGHTKTVSALAVDKAGSRVLSGSYDYQAKLWDFGGMNETLAAFRSFEPLEGHQVRALNYSPSGDMFLAVTGGAQAKVYTRDAGEVCTLARGDMYILQQKLTKGHSSPLTSGWFHPRDRGCIVTSGIDGTVRLWDVNRPDNNISVVIPRGVMRGTAVSATAISKDGKLIAAAATDGSLHLLKSGTKAYDYRDSSVVSDAHVKGSETSALLFASDNVTLFSRGGEGDHTLKSWDVRALRQPLAVLAGLENGYPETDIALSPDEKVVVTGTSARDKDAAAAAAAADGAGASGHAVFIERAGLKPLQRVSMGCRSVVRSVWHSGINQLLFGCSDGVIRLLYDPVRSNKGVLQCIGRRARAKNPLDFEMEGGGAGQPVHMGAIITPHALPGMRGDESALSQNRKRKRDKAAAALAPEAPLAGRFGVGGRAAGSSSMAAFHLSKSVSMRTDPREKDPRQALLAMDALAKADPVFLGKAYAATQPKTIFAEVPEEERTVRMTEEEIALYNKREGAKEGEGRKH